MSKGARTFIHCHAHSDCQPMVPKATKHDASKPKAIVLQQCNGNTKAFCGHSNNEHINRTEESKPVIAFDGPVCTNVHSTYGNDCAITIKIKVCVCSIQASEICMQFAYDRCFGIDGNTLKI